MMQVNTLVWFRADLRLDDNPALFSACQQGGVIACFLRPKTQWQAHDWGLNRIAYTERCVLDLQASLQDLNIPLLVLEADHFQQQVELLMTLCQRFGVQQLFANEEPELNERQRDSQVQQRCRALGINCQFFHDQSLLPLGQVLKPDGSPYRVFTAFCKQVMQRIESQPIVCLPAPKAPSPTSLSNVDLADLPLCVLDPVMDSIQQRWSASEKQAHQQLALFSDEAIANYAVQRDFPANPQGTSQLSHYLATGKLSIRRCWQYAEQVKISQPHQAASAQCWQNELIWREFYRHLLVLNPELCRYRAFKPATEQIQWQQDPEALQRWQQGQTGFPLVDAAMRQLLTTGWMHNRLRMLVAVFLSKYLLIDWHEGERWFMQHLIDADLASNNGGWQWAASTGTDAVPYFRLLSPYRQAERFDAQGEFIAHYVPELAHLPAKQRIQPKGYVKGYPSPMLDLKAGKARMMAAFKASMGKNNAE